MSGTFESKIGEHLKVGSVTQGFHSNVTPQKLLVCVKQRMAGPILGLEGISPSKILVKLKAFGSCILGAKLGLAKSCPCVLGWSGQHEICPGSSYSAGVGDGASLH